ncbi:hypothetical protein V6N12_016224 [Hibiscus sabdariffa]|uniref:Uncharacterized protein n=1 Tax=Hibiscus sabdariffa TaxID=183260 RepID=A0ABR2AR27_9ROSI
MLVCSCAARLAGGGWDSGVFGAAVWQPHGGFRQFCWLHRDGLVQFRWQNRGGPVQSRWQHHGDPMQFRWQHRGGPVQFRWQHRLARMPPGITGAGMMVWCASSGTPMPLLATMFVTALVVGSTLSRPVTVAGAMIGCLAWRPSLFSWCTSKLTATVFLSIACPGVAPFPWPINLVACFAEGPMGRPLLFGYVFGSTWGLLVVAKGAPLVRPRLSVPWLIGGCWVCLGSAWGCWSVPRVPPWFARSTALGLGISDPRVRFVPMAFDGCLCGGCSLVGYLALPSELFAGWLLLHRVVLSARPRESLISCFTSSLLRASFGNPCFDLCRTPTSSRIALLPCLYLPCRRHPVLACLTSPKVEGQKFQYGAWLRAPLPMRSATRPRGRLALVADDLEATEVADPADPVLDPPGLASETSAQPDPAGPEVRADPNAEVRVNPSVAPTATAPAAPEVRTDPTSAVRMNPTAAAPAVQKGQAVPATAAPMVRKGQAVPATAAPLVRKGQTVPATAATALRTDLPVPNIVAPVVRTPQRAADSPPAPLVPLETDAMVEDVVDEDSSGQNLVADGSLPDDAPYDPLVHAETSAMLEEALEISRDCVLLADMDGVLQADGEDLVNAATHEAADSIIREVAAKILGADAPSDGSDPPIALAKMGPSPSASPPKSGLSKSAPAGLRRAAMPVVPEHQEFDEWCAARSRTPPANVAVHPSEARASSIPPPRPHKRLAPSSDPSRAKRSRASASSSSRIPSSTKAGMSSVNNSPAETARQSRREK